MYYLYNIDLKEQCPSNNSPESFLPSAVYMWKSYEGEISLSLSLCPSVSLSLFLSLYIYRCIYTVTTFKYVEGGPDRKAPEVVWNTSSYV